GSGIPERQERSDGKQNAGRPCNQESRSPPERVGHHSAKGKREQRACRYAERINCECRGSLLPWRIISNQRQRRGLASRLAQSDGKPGQQQLDKILRKAANRREGAPEGERSGYD